MIIPVSNRFVSSGSIFSLNISKNSSYFKLNISSNGQKLTELQIFENFRKSLFYSFSVRFVARPIKLVYSESASLDGSEKYNHGHILKISVLAYFVTQKLKFSEYRHDYTFLSRLDLLIPNI